MDSAAAPGDEELFARVDAYDWAGDQEFSSGMRAVLNPSMSPEQIISTTLRARCFYFGRKFASDVNFDGYKAWCQQHGHNVGPVPVMNGATHQTAPVDPENLANITVADPTGNPTPSSQLAPSANDTAQADAPSYPATFAQIVELITKGDPIPGIKDIPDTVLEGQATEPLRPKRKKPWEKDTTGDNQASTTQTAT